MPVSASAEITDGAGGTLYFAGWTVENGSGTFADPVASGTTFTMSDVDTEIKANYTGGYSVTVADGTHHPGTGKLCAGAALSRSQRKINLRKNYVSITGRSRTETENS